MKATINQSGFTGGLQARYDLLKPGATTYPLLINARVRENNLACIFRPLRDEQLPTGNYQGLIAVGSILTCFVSGQAHYRDVEAAAGWLAIPSLNMDPAVATIDSTAIPASTVNFKREGPIDNVKFNNSPARSSLEGIIATDGVTQPWFIYPSGTGLAARVTQTYAQWTDEAREYVPVGRFPKFCGKTLYMAVKSPTGSVLNRIARSVSGRPLDFVINIVDSTGDKGGDCYTTGHSIGFDAITGIYNTSFDDGSFIVGSLRNTTGVTPTFEQTPFNEPLFRNTELFKVGLLNNISILDLNGDAGFLTQTGLHSFNDTEQRYVASNNDPISAQISKLLATPLTYGCVAEFDDYGLAAVETIYGPGVLVYDKRLSTFIAIDLYEGIGAIKQFAKTTSANGDRLFFITADNRLFEWGASDEYETARYYMGDWNSGIAGTMQRLDTSDLIFSDVTEETPVKVAMYVDKQLVESCNFIMPEGGMSVAPVLPLPFKIAQAPNTGCIRFTPTQYQGFGIGTIVSWSGPAKVVYSTFTMDIDESQPPLLSIPTAGVAPQRFALAGDFAAGDTLNAITALGITTIGLGDFFYEAGDYASYAKTLTRIRERGQLLAVAGNHEYDLDGGLKYMQTYGNGVRYRSVVQGNVEWFLLSAGWNTATLGSTNPLYEPDGNTIGSRQYNWLKGAVAASTARWKFVCWHEPPYSSGTYSPGYAALRWDYRSIGIDAVFSAHDHVYQRHILDGLNYVGVGTGGRTLTQLAATKSAGYQNGRSAFGYLELTTDHFDARICHVGATSRFDDFVISK